MEELQILLEKREKILAKVREIERSCEGIENEENAKQANQLNIEKVELTEQKKKLSTQMSAIEAKLHNISNEISAMSGKGMDILLEALKNQRWYFFKNKKTVLFDKDSGLLWANLNYFPYGVKQGGDYYQYGWRDIKYQEWKEEIDKIINAFNFDSITGFRLPEYYEFWNAISNHSIPFHEGEGCYLKNKRYWFVDALRIQDTYYYNSVKSLEDIKAAYIMPCSSFLIDGLDYQNEVLNTSNSLYTEKERLQHLLDIFVKHELQPMFEDEKITELYNKIYIEKAELQKELQTLELEIQQLQEEQKRLEELAAKEKETLSSTFNYQFLLSKYNMEQIGSSMIQYYEAVQCWIDELLQKLDDYETQKENVILNFNTISLKLSKKYEYNRNLTELENDLLEQRQAFFSKNLSLGMNNVKSKLLSVKKQADDLEYRIDEINEGQNSIQELALLEKQDRIGFAFLAENTAKIIKNALLKIEFFESHHQFVLHAIDIWENWSENYKVFKTTYKEDLKNTCKEDDVEEEIWTKWYDDWNKLRFAIEQKIQPIIEKGLKNNMPTHSNNEKNVPERLVAILEDYKNNIDKFYLEGKKGIYQKYVFQSGGELQEKFETESILYGFASTLQSQLQDVIFDCKNAEDRIFILNWSNSLLDIPIDEILVFVADNDLKSISQEILNEFAALKQKNYDIYLADAKAYAQEKSKREKEYNSLVFKMRKDLMKQQ